MTEYISREDAEKALLERCKETGYGGLTPDDIRLVMRTSWRIPAADVRTVVLCKDCVHFVRGELFGDTVCDYHYLHQYHAEPYEFCSHAEKKEES